MKKIQIIFSILAIMIASAGVFASSTVFATEYFEDTSASGNCNVLITTSCSDSGTLPCKNGSNNVYKIVNETGPCTQVMRIN